MFRTFSLRNPTTTDRCSQKQCASRETCLDNDRICSEQLTARVNGTARVFEHQPARQVPQKGNRHLPEVDRSRRTLHRCLDLATANTLPASGGVGLCVSHDWQRGREKERALKSAELRLTCTLDGVAQKFRWFVKLYRALAGQAPNKCKLA